MCDSEDDLAISSYLHRRLSWGEGIVTLSVCVCVRRAATVRRISLGGEGNALYPVLSSVKFESCINSDKFTHVNIAQTIVTKAMSTPVLLQLYQHNIRHILTILSYLL